MDFGDNGFVTPSGEPEVTPPSGVEQIAPVSIDGEEIQYDENGNPITPIEKEVEKPSSTEEPESIVEVGTQYQIGEDVYTADENGNLLDKDGNIFKEAKDVKEWLNSFEQEEEVDENELSINSIQKALDISITDEEGNEVEFENTPEGVKAYVDQVIESSRQEHYQTAIQTLYAQYPFVEDMIDYYRANGNSLEGYGQVPDRSNIVIDENDEAQQEYIIRSAWNERGQKGNVEGYIQYLKSTGNLYSTAQEELIALQETDKQYREYIKAEADKAEAERIENAKAYWNNVHEIVKSRSLGDYKIPESIVVTRNGQKTTATVEDFFKYLYEVDKDGKSRYVHDLEKEDPKTALTDNILRAYLKFTGGGYSNLVDMAINNKEVTKLILKSKNNKKPSISVRKPTAPTKKETDLGYK